MLSYEQNQLFHPLYSGCITQFLPLVTLQYIHFNYYLRGVAASPSWHWVDEARPEQICNVSRVTTWTGMFLSDPSSTLLHGANTRDLVCSAEAAMVKSETPVRVSSSWECKEIYCLLIHTLAEHNPKDTNSTLLTHELHSLRPMNHFLKKDISPSFSTLLFCDFTSSVK